MKPLHWVVEGRSLSGAKHRRAWRLIILSTANVARNAPTLKRDKRIKGEALEAGTAVPDINASSSTI